MSRPLTRDGDAPIEDLAAMFAEHNDGPPPPRPLPCCQRCGRPGLWPGSLCTPCKVYPPCCDVDDLPF